MCKNDAEVSDAVGSVMGYIGDSSACLLLVQQIIQLCKEKPDHYETQLLDLTANLGLYIRSELKDPKEVFKQTEPLFQALSSALADKRSNAQLVASVIGLGDSIASAAVRCYNQRDAALALQPLAKILAPEVSHILGDSADPHRLQNNGQVVASGFDFLATMLSERTTRSAVVLLTKDCMLARKALIVVDTFDQEPAAIASAQRFLRALAQGADGCAVIEHQSQAIKENLATLLDSCSDMILRKNLADHGASALYILAGMLQSSATNRKDFCAVQGNLNTLERLGAVSLPVLLGTLDVLVVASKAMPQEQADMCIKQAADRLKVTLATEDLAEADRRAVIVEVVSRAVSSVFD